MSSLPILRRRFSTVTSRFGSPSFEYFFGWVFFLRSEGYVVIGHVKLCPKHPVIIANRASYVEFSANCMSRFGLKHIEANISAHAGVPIADFILLRPFSLPINSSIQQKLEIR